MSLGVSLAVHGVAVASIVLAFHAPWSPSEPKDGSRQIIAARMESPDQAILHEPEEDPLVELDEPEEELEPIPLDDFDDVLSEPVPDPFIEFASPLTFRAPTAPPNLDPEALLEDPELPRETLAADSIAVPVPVKVEAPTNRGGDQATDTPASDTAVSPSPIPSECPPPVYPRLADRRGWSGTVVLLIDVAADGTVSHVRIESSSGHTILDEAAVAAVRTWRYQPGTLGGEAAAHVVRKPIRFAR